MRNPVARPVVVLLALTVGFVACGILTVDYTRPLPVFCSEGGGCEAVRQSWLARPGGIPLPYLGLLGLLALASLALLRGPRVRLLNLLVAGAGVLVTGGLILAQALMGHFCKYCMVVDVSTLIVGGLAIDRYRAGWDAPGGRLLQALVPWAFVTAFATPFVLARSQPSPIPPLIVAEVGKTPRGEVTLVDFVDFECPFCRQLHERLSPMLASKPGKFRVVRKLVPLTRIHPHALAAAKAACCAEALGKGDAMADVLFRTSVDDLTPDGCANLAASLGLPLDAYKACVDSPETTARLARDRQDFDKTAVKGDGLPLMWIGPRKVMGAADEATLSKVMGEALASARD